MKKAIVSWSGGKDSCFATWKAMQQGYEIMYLVNMVSKTYKRVGFHGIENTLVQKQAEAVGIPLSQGETTGIAYQKELTEHIKIKAQEADTLVFGDIYLTDCLAMAQTVAKDVGLSLIEPLWGQKPEVLIKDFIASGFKSIIVSTQASLLGKEWVGRVIDQSFIDDIKKLPNIDPCGENGEFHSFVVDGPMFKKRIDITKTATIQKDGYWFLDIQEYKLTNK